MNARITNETAQIIANCPAFENLKEFHLDINSELFNFQVFAEAMKVGYSLITFFNALIKHFFIEAT